MHEAIGSNAGVLDRTDAVRIETIQASSLIDDLASTFAEAFCLDGTVANCFAKPFIRMTGNRNGLRAAIFRMNDLIPADDEVAARTGPVPSGCHPA